MTNFAFNIVIFISLSMITNVLSAENTINTNGNRGLGDLDFLDKKGVLSSMRGFDSSNLMEGNKGVSISSPSPPAVTVTPTTTLSVTPVTNQTAQDVHYDAFKNPLDAADKKFENSMLDDSNGNLRRGTNVHCGTTHIAVSCANRRRRKTNESKDIEMKDESQILDEQVEDQVEGDLQEY